MDGGVALTPTRSRAATCGWCGPRQRHSMGQLTNLTYGAFDLLKILSSSPGSNTAAKPVELSGSGQRALFHQGDRPEPAALWLWLDVRNTDCPPDPFENAQKYPGVAVGARGKTSRPDRITGIPPGSSVCGSSPTRHSIKPPPRGGIPERFYNDPNYYLSKDLVRPYRVGMSCGFCHVGPNPEKPPADPEAPRWENLSGTVGAQYFWSTASWHGTPIPRHSCSSCCIPPGRLVRHLARIERQHQQPAHDERRLQPLAAAGSGQALGPGDPRSGQPGEQAVQRFCQPGAVDPVLSTAQHVWTPMC